MIPTVHTFRAWYPCILLRNLLHIDIRTLQLEMDSSFFKPERLRSERLPSLKNVFKSSDNLKGWMEMGGGLYLGKLKFQKCSAFYM